MNDKRSDGKKEVQKKKYEAPKICYEGILTSRAGSPPNDGVVADRGKDTKPEDLFGK